MIRSADAVAAGVFPYRGMTSDVEVVHGDPDAAGLPFVIRIRELPGAIVPPHSHPVDEHITVIEGEWSFGFGEAFDETALQTLPTGSYAFAPSGASMFGYSRDGAVVQVHGVGPFHIRWAHDLVLLTETRARFRFGVGDTVKGPRGEGRIRQGYASGDLRQYEIDGATGLYMAREEELEPA